MKSPWLSGHSGRGQSQGFFERSLMIRVLIGLLFAVGLWFFLHAREVRLETLELGKQADKYIVAQVDYDYPDQALTSVLKKQAVRDVGTVYRLEVDEIANTRVAFEKALTQEPKWREEAPGATFEEMYQGVDRLAGALSAAHFTDARTLKKMESLGLSTNTVFLLTPPESGEVPRLPNEFWQVITQEAFAGSGLSERARELIETPFVDRPWVLQEDAAATGAVTRKATQSVAPVRTSVRAGSRIIGKGERVGSSHVASLTAMNQVLAQQRNLWRPETIFGSLIIALFFTAVLTGYLMLHEKAVYDSNRRLFLLTVIALLSLGLAKGTEYLLLRSTVGLHEAVRLPLFVPFAAILIGSLLGARLAAFMSAFLAIVMTISLAVDANAFLIVNFIAALAAVFTTRMVSRRKEVFVVCANAWLSCGLVVIGLHLYQQSFWTWELLTDLGTTLVFMLFTAILVVGLLPLLEGVFSILTDVSLVEFMDPTRPLLRRLSLEAPGTYQHSIVVGNLAEAGATAIGANSLLCRVGALYHDIGKVMNPQYFTENQQMDVNIHHLLTPLESAEAIMAHVPEGIALARKHGIPEPVIEIIREHHGTTLVYFFYHKAREQEGDAVDESAFRYPGPKPRSKEAAIIMIADTMEAASRSLDEFTEQSVSQMVERLVRDKAEDGQFSQCNITFEELGVVVKTIAESLLVAGHKRIKYPMRESPPAGGADDPAINSG